MSGKVSTTWNVLSENCLVENFPLHRACRDGDVALLTNFLQQKDTAKLHLSLEDTYYGWTPLHWAAYFGKPDCVRVLLTNSAVSEKSTADLQTSHFNQTPSHIAAFAGHPQCLQELLQAGADPSAKDYLGETPLHKAARTGSSECVSLLVNNKSQLGITNNCNQTAADLALSCGGTDMADYLLKSLAKDESHLISSNGYYGFQPNKGHNNAEDEQNIETCMDMDTDSASANFANGTHISPAPITNGAHHGTANGFAATNLSANDRSGHIVPNGFSNGHVPTISNGVTNGFQNVFQNGVPNGTQNPSKPVPNGDITLMVEVSQNQVPIAGKKRSREETFSTACQTKRVRTEGPDSATGMTMLSGAPPPPVNQASLNNNGAFGKASCTVGECSVTEHFDSVMAESGYNAIKFQMMMADVHGC